jgi:hypothetical protein
VVDADGKDHKKDNKQDVSQGLVVIHGRWLAAFVSHGAFSGAPTSCRSAASGATQVSNQLDLPAPLVGCSAC